MVLTFLDCFFLKSNQRIKDGIKLFMKTKSNTLPIVSEEGQYLGLIVLKDLVKHLLKEENILMKDLIIWHEPILAEANPLNVEFDEMDTIDIVPVIKTENMEFEGFYIKEEIVTLKYEKHRELVHELNQVINSSYNGILAINSEGNIIVYNTAAERIMGKPKDKVFGKHISYVDPDKALLDTLKTQEVSVNVKRVINGYDILSNRSPLIYEGRCIGAVGVFVDRSDIEKVSYELESYKKLSKELNDILEASYDGLYICDKEGRVIRVNSSWEKICGLSREYTIGKTAQELIKDGWYDNSAALLTLKNKEVSTTMLEITSGPKKGQIIMATGTPIFDKNGELDLVVVNVRDITYLEHLKTQLVETMELSKRYATELEEIRLQAKKMEDIVVRSPEMQRIMELAIRVSKVDSTVIITGESGVGKDVIAKKIHYLSKRKDKSYIKINCGAIPEHLLESELFGYEGGAFTGAKKEGKLGMFELASGGTLFLDEVGDLPLCLQVKLLRAIQEKEIVRVGGVKTIKVDVRLISATNKNLELMIREGTFREDLFYRLNVVNIQIPPLRERKEDMEYLLGFMLNKHNQNYGLNKKLAAPVVERLLSYNWPGNIREMENMIERLVVLTDEEQIQIRHLPVFLQEELSASKLVTLNSIIPLKDAIEEVEQQLIRKALDKYVTTRKVAKMLGVNQSTVVRKIKQYSIEKHDAS
ncbi:sigma 54-interacting transcriptional regulator [Serpentinicella alkaliphila]|uniref:HTH-type transcriptional regulatory protein TyrR n=1 Tax=Serpentinicella alkaliphila TaxID=1734049 RepID=A0A4R2TLB1_9FIRM|nr:sigma 54-interacting transcriptional regulator [Serpentinicella alkaliphila]QUH25914.1 sigma 54-interacting transcriptional regulator [Serpentinicella alkaliphila]TCQ01985.1 PAS domain S-box-containing protein/TyrR family helix-turn-helix protein [Serpentinicella alkaliphila]